MERPGPREARPERRPGSRPARRGSRRAPAEARHGHRVHDAPATRGTSSPRDAGPAGGGAAARCPRSASRRALRRARSVRRRRCLAFRSGPAPGVRGLPSSPANGVRMVNARTSRSASPQRRAPTWTRDRRRSPCAMPPERRQGAKCQLRPVHRWPGLGSRKPRHSAETRRAPIAERTSHCGCRRRRWQAPRMMGRSPTHVADQRHQVTLPRRCSGDRCRAELAGARCAARRTPARRDRRSAPRSSDRARPLAARAASSAPRAQNDPGEPRASTVAAAMAEPKGRATTGPAPGLRVAVTTRHQTRPRRIDHAGSHIAVLAPEHSGCQPPSPALCFARRHAQAPRTRSRRSLSASRQVDEAVRGLAAAVAAAADGSRAQRRDRAAPRRPTRRARA